MKTASVWGANGYIGQHLIKILHEAQWEVKCYDIQDHLQGALELNYTRIDVTNEKSLQQLPDFQEDYIFYFIGLTGTINSIESYDAFIGLNEVGFLNVLNKVKNCATKPHIVYPSSRLVYKGQKNKELQEDDIKEFKTIYASSKYNGELYLKMFANLYDINYTIYRICVPYGNTISSTYSYGTTGFFLSRARKGLPITLYGDGSLKRTFTHVEDICLQIEILSRFGLGVNECFNIKGEVFSLRFIAEYIAKHYNVQCQYSDWPEAALKLESGDTIFDSSKISALLTTDLEHDFKTWVNKLN